MSTPHELPPSSASPWLALLGTLGAVAACFLWIALACLTGYKEPKL